MESVNSKMSKIIPYIIVILFGFLCAWVAWDMKPDKYIKGDSIHDTLTLPVDSTNIIKQATIGLWSGTYEEARKKFGSTFSDTFRVDTLVIDSLTVYDTVVVAIPFLESRDTLQYSGYELLGEDTLRASFRTRIHTLAYLAPVNAIENAIVIDSLRVIVPPRPEKTITELAIEHWKWLLAVFGVGYLFGK